MSQKQFNVFVDTGRELEEGKTFLRQIGAAWHGTSESGTEYFSIQLDAAPITGKLVAYPVRKD